MVYLLALVHLLGIHLFLLEHLILPLELEIGGSYNGTQLLLHIILYLKLREVSDYLA